MAFQMIRKKTRRVEIGSRAVGGGEPILIQSMTNTRTEDVKATVDQIQRLTAAGCEIIRCAKYGGGRGFGGDQEGHYHSPGGGYPL